MALDGSLENGVAPDALHEAIEAAGIEEPISDNTTPRNSTNATGADPESEKEDERRQSRDDGKMELKQEDCMNELGFTYPGLKRWVILTVVFWIQISMNFNTSIYANAVSGVQEKFHVSAQAARMRQYILR